MIFFIIPALNISANMSSVSGVVLDNETHEPIPGAVIKFIETGNFITTDSYGKFFIDCKNDFKSVTLEVTHLAYKETLLQISIQSVQGETVVIYMIPKSILINPVIVSDFKSYSKLDSLQELSNVLKGKDLQRELGQTLAATLKNETGISMRSMGPAPARPVIRGLGSNRVFMSEDGSKTIDLSATSPDHAVTIDPFNLLRIEVFRGPRVLLKTPVTIGGIVNVVRNEIPEELHDHIFGSIGTFGETANSGYLVSSTLEVPVMDFALRGELSERRAFNLNTPEGRLNNSYSKNFNYSAGGSYLYNSGFIGMSFRNFELDYGVPGGFIGAHPKGVDISMYRKQFNIRSNLIFDSAFFDFAELSFNRVLYRHKEFEASGTLSTEFRIISNQGYINLHHKKTNFFEKGTAGLSFEHRDFQIGGLVFTSPAVSFNISAFAYETLSYGRFNIEAAVRYNYDFIEPERKKFDEKIGEVDTKEFHTYSLSFTSLYELTKIVFVGFNVNRSSRVPTIEELFSRGPHLAAYSYEIGNASLEDERGFGLDVFVYHKFKDLFWNINIFRNDLSYYIIPRNTGEINFQTFLPVYQSEGAPVLLYGVESQIDWNVFSFIKLSNSASYTHGEFKGSGKALPQIPPVKGKLEVQFVSEKWALGINLEWAGAQKKVDRFESQTQGYMILNSFVHYTFTYDHFIHAVSFNVDNVLNGIYRNHLSRVKSIMPEAGRNFRLTYKMYFSI